VSILTAKNSNLSKSDVSIGDIANIIGGTDQLFGKGGNYIKKCPGKMSAGLLTTIIASYGSPQSPETNLKREYLKKCMTTADY
jgi:hypothetical protein